MNGPWGSPASAGAWDDAERQRRQLGRGPAWTGPLLPKTCLGDGAIPPRLASSSACQRDGTPPRERPRGCSEKKLTSGFPGKKSLERGGEEERKEPDTAENKIRETTRKRAGPQEAEKTSKEAGNGKARNQGTQTSRDGRGPEKKEKPGTAEPKTGGQERDSQRKREEGGGAVGIKTMTQNTKQKNRAEKQSASLFCKHPLPPHSPHGFPPSLQTDGRSRTLPGAPHCSLPTSALGARPWMLSASQSR